jgi:hypothetical protein
MLAGIGGLAAGALLARPAQAGPLNPPAGPVAPTGKTTQELFDATTSEARRGWTPVSAATTPGVPGTSTFQISQPGAYYLTGPVAGGANTFAIRVTAGNVLLDLNGHTVSATGEGKFAVVLDGGQPAVRVSGGILSVSNSATGVGAAGDSVLLEDLLVAADTGGYGFFFNGGQGPVIRRCRFHGNGGSYAIYSGAGVGAVVEDVTVGATGTPWVSGFYFVPRAVFRRCTLSGCNAAIYVGNAGHVEQCVVAGPTSGAGITVGQDSTVVDCWVNRAGAVGIEVGSQSLVDRCRSTTNGIGAIRAGGESLVRNCYVDWHPNASQYGIKATGNRVQVVDNTIQSCTTGIDFGGVSGCVALRNLSRGTPNPIAVSAGGNWYPSVDFSTLNTATNPFANLFTNV